MFFIRYKINNQISDKYLLVNDSFDKKYLLIMELILYFIKLKVIV